MSNLSSVAKAVKYVAPNEKVIISSNPNEIDSAEKVIFPGQGAAEKCMESIHNKKLSEVIKKNSSEKPFLGICMGMQVLMEFSNENNGTECLGIIKGSVERFETQENQKIKIPHMGWNKVHLSNTHPMWNKIDSDSRFYFVHSFYAEITNKSLEMATSSHGEKFTCAIAKDNIFAVQFHPEKSSELGLQLLKNFISWNI